MKKFSAAFFLIFFCLSGFSQSFNGADAQGNRQPAPPPDGTTFFLPSSSDGNGWISVGPFGGDVTDLAIITVPEGRIFATAGAPFSSDDNGENWTLLESLSTLAAGPVNCIEASDNGILLATATYTWGKVFRSTDGGSTWQSKTLPVNIPALCITMDPNDTNTMYVGLSSNTASSENKVIVKSVNGGVSWTALDLTAALPVGYGVTSVCVDPANSQHIYAIGREGFSNSIVAASFDGGTTWEDRTGSLPGTKPLNAVSAGGGAVYVAGGQLFGTQNVGVYKSTDNGATWTNISGSFPNKVSNTILIDPANPQRLFVGTEGDGIYSSTDGGTTWSYTTNGAGENGAARSLMVMPGNPDQLFAGYLSIAVCSSSDGGNSWEYASNGIATLLVNDVEIDNANPAWVLAGFEAENSGGCYLSSDTGNTWSLVTTLPGTRYSKTGVLADGALVAWSNGPSSVAQEGLYKSTNQGTTWANMGPNVGNLFETEIFALAVSETDPGLIFIGGNNFGVNGWKGVIHRSKDGGQTWDNVYISADDYDSFRYLCIDPQSGDQVVYAAMKSETEGKILKSEDGGDTWNVISGGLPSDKWFGSIVTDPVSSQKLIAGTGGYGSAGTAWISTDAGGSWTGTDLSLGTYSKVQDLCINPDYTQTIYAATGDDGVFLSTDGGSQWDPDNDGMPATNITAFSSTWISGSVRNVFASTSTNSIYKTVVYDPTTGIEKQAAVKELSVFPNPSGGSFEVLTGTNNLQGIRIEIYNAAGILVGTYQPVTVTGSGVILHTGLPAGFYTGRVQAAGEWKWFKLVLKD